MPEINSKSRHLNIGDTKLHIVERGGRTRGIEGTQAMANGLPNARLVVFEESGHMTYVKENEKYVKTVREFPDKNIRSQ